MAGPKVEDHAAQIQAFAAAGYDEVYVADMGPHHQQMIQAYGRDVLPAARDTAA
ncbi:MAG: hypothetical protein ACRDQD_17825 [Nocardioidaceae bacterium]